MVAGVYEFEKLVMINKSPEKIRIINIAKKDRIAKEYALFALGEFLVGGASRFGTGRFRCMNIKNSKNRRSCQNLEYHYSLLKMTESIIA